MRTAPCRALMVSIVVTMLLFFSGRLFCADFPAHSLTNVVVWGAMGGTDVCSRVISKAMSEELKTDIDVVNMIGGVSGSWGMRYVMNQPHDGYTLCGISEGCAASAALGGDAPPMREWEIFVAATTSTVLSVAADSPFRTQKDLFDAAREGRRLTIAASGRGTVHHLNLLLLEHALGAPLVYREFPGSSPSMKAAEEGEVDAVIASVPEQTGLIRAGKLRPLGVFDEVWLELDGIFVPTVSSGCPNMGLPFYTWLAVAVPGDTPNARVEVLRSAFHAALASKPVRRWALENRYALPGVTGLMATKLFASIEVRSREVLSRRRQAAKQPGREHVTDEAGG